MIQTVSQVTQQALDVCGPDAEPGVLRWVQEVSETGAPVGAAILQQHWQGSMGKLWLSVPTTKVGPDGKARI